VAARVSVWVRQVIRRLSVACVSCLDARLLCCGGMSQRFTPAQYSEVRCIYEFCDGYENVGSVVGGPVLWPPRSPDLTVPRFCVCGRRKETRCRKHARQQLPCLAVGECDCCLEQQRCALETAAGICNSCKTCLVKCSRKLM
jgi:hypothetical protein